MKYVEPILTRVGLLLFTTVLIGACWCGGVSALTLAADDSAIDPTMPLVVTAYEARLKPVTFDSKGKVLTQSLEDISIIELYNSGSTPLSIATLHIFDAADTSRELLFSGDMQNYIFPNGHVVLANTNVLAGTTYTIDGWSKPATNDAATPGLKFTLDTYRVSQTDIKVSDTLEKRSYGVSSYLSTFVDAVPIGTPLVDPYLTDIVFDDGLYEIPVGFPGKIVELYPYSSDCAPNDMSILCGDYIKIHMDKDADLATLSSFVVRTDSNSSSRTSSNTFHITKAMINDDGYLTISLDDTGKRISLTNSGGYVWVEDLYGLKTYSETMTRYESASSDEQGYSWDLNSNDTWQWSTSPQPFSVNVVTAPAQEVTVCPAGKYLNPDTGRCRTVEEAVNALSACPEGQYRNPLTNRCKQIASTTSTLVPCGEGQERNPLTNRCRSIASAVAELLPCDEGYERNPATNRCRKVAGVSTTAAASNQLVEDEKESGPNIWTWSLVGVAVLGVVGYGVYEWRHELLGAGQAIAAKFGKK